MYENVVPQLLAKYDLAYKKIHAMQKGYRNESYAVELNDGQMANLMVFKNEPGMLQRIQRADMVSNYLNQHGIPSRTRLDERLVALVSKGGTTYAGLYTYLPGSTIAWEAYTKEHLKQLGAVMAHMHAKLQLTEAISLKKSVFSQINIVDELLILLKRIELYFDQASVRQAMRSKLGVNIDVNFRFYKECLNLGSQLPRQHILHMDLVRSNVLFEDTADTVRISGLIDFEKVSYGSSLFDIARTLAFLLVDCKYKTAAEVRKYFLYSGYSKRGGGTIDTQRVKTGAGSEMLLNHYVRFFLLHDFYKFLLHNPYEFLAQNEHYLRTRDILQAFDMGK